ncbi:DUF3704 domain-containing protein [Escherichia coli]|nr:DUF3704 domain-containing protein [Escherichia coli]
MIQSLAWELSYATGAALKRKKKNTAAMNVGVHVSFRIIVLSGYMPKSGIAGSYGTSMYRFLRYLNTFSIVVVPAYIPTNSAGGFPFLHTLSSICSLWTY